MTKQWRQIQDHKVCHRILKQESVSDGNRGQGTPTMIYIYAGPTPIRTNTIAPPSPNMATSTMQESTMADLKTTPSTYQSSRELFDVLFGQDTALPLIEAASAGNETTLQHLLSQPQYQKIAFDGPHCIYSQDRPSNLESPVRGVLAMPFLNLKRVLVHAATNGHAGAISVLLNFASQQDIDPSSIITYWAIVRSIENGHAAVIEAMASWDSAKIVNFHLGHSGPFPLDLAVRRGKVDVAAVLLDLGSDPSADLSPNRSRATETLCCAVQPIPRTRVWRNRCWNIAFLLPSRALCKLLLSSVGWIPCVF